MYVCRVDFVTHCLVNYTQLNIIIIIIDIVDTDILNTDTTDTDDKDMDFINTNILHDNDDLLERSFSLSRLRDMSCM
jgi:hypothetical protein